MYQLSAYRVIYLDLDGFKPLNDAYGRWAAEDGGFRDVSAKRSKSVWAFSEQPYQAPPATSFP